MSSNESSQREWDLVIYGATGDAGTAIAMYVANNIDKCHESANDSDSNEIFRWAIAGRTESKLNGLRSRIIVSRSPPSIRRDEIGVLVANSASSREMSELAKSAKLIISAVGPYTALGETLYEACVENGTNYVDITGEVDWVFQMRTKYGRRADETGSVMCSFAGYDSVPCDITLLAACRALSECDNSSTGCDELTLSSAETVVKLKGGTFPRGTIRTMILKSVEGADFCKNLVHFVSSKRKDAQWKAGLSLVRWLLPRWSPEFGAFTIPHFMGWCNIPVVHNSSSSIDCIYHDRMALPYTQGCLGTGYGLLQTLLLYSVFLAIAPFFLCFPIIAALIPSTAKFLLKLFDSLQYRGSTSRNQKHLEDSTVDVWTYATSASSGSKARVHMHVEGDAGIMCTALLAGETAFSMIELDDRNELPRGIIGSPSMIVGDALIERLQDAEAIGDFCTLSVEIIDPADDDDDIANNTNDKSSKKEN